MRRAKKTSVSPKKIQAKDLSGEIQKSLFDVFIEVPITRIRMLILMSYFTPPLILIILGILLHFKLWQFIVLMPFALIIGFKIPKRYIKRKLKKRIETIDNQLLDTLTMLAGSLKAGLSLNQALEMAVEDLQPPIRDEIDQILKLNRLGEPLDEALQKLAKRVPTENIEILVTSITTLLETGGNLAETFDTIAKTIDDRAKIQGKIKSMTTQGEYQGLIAALTPIIFIAVIYYINPAIARGLLTTWMGWIVLGIALALDALGYFLIKKIVRIKV